MKNFNIKKSIYLGVAVATIATQYSCKEFTELDPLAYLPENVAFSTPENIQLAVNGMYWSAAVGEYEGTTGRGYPFGGAALQQGDMRGEDMVNLQAFYQLTYQNTYTPTTANNKNHWEQLYALINQANVIIEGIDNAVEEDILDASVGDPYKGEALFFRALAHHELLIHFSRPYVDQPTTNLGVPYRTQAITTVAAAQEANTMGRGTVAEAYTKLLEDLDEAENLLPATRSSVGQKISRVTKAGAIALKTRIKLHQEDFTGVIVEGIKLGTDATSGDFTSPIGGFKLEDDPTRPFLSYADNTESIFSIANSANSNPGVNGSIAAMYGPSDFNARDLIAISPNLYNAPFWLSDDLRKTELTYAQPDGPNVDWPLVYAYKYRRYGINDDWTPILRYAEVLLNVAEAYAIEGNSAQALRLLNAVRDRSVGVANSFGTTVPADLREAIYNERRIEFIAEGRRWADLHRLILTPYGAGGIPAKLLPTQLSATVYDGSTILTPSQAAVSYTDHLFLWPIPQSETDTNPTLRDQQNPNY